MDPAFYQKIFGDGLTANDTYNLYFKVLPPNEGDYYELKIIRFHTYIHKRFLSPKDPEISNYITYRITKE